MSSGPATQAGKAKPEKVWVCRPHTPIVDCRYDKRKGNFRFSPQVAGILWIAGSNSIAGTVRQQVLHSGPVRRQHRWVRRWRRQQNLDRPLGTGLPSVRPETLR